MPSSWSGLLILAAAVAGAALAVPVEAHPESAAASLRDDVLRAGHDPEVVQAHTQWTGFLELRPGSNVTGAFYQICRVGQACFAPPTPAETVGNTTFRFDTATYLANGRPVDFQPGWRIGVTWLLEEKLPNGTTRAVRFPVGPDVLSPECQGDAALACSEAHYLAFDVVGQQRDSPPLPIIALLALIVGLAAARRGGNSD